MAEDPFDIDETLPTVEQMAENLPVWKSTIERITLRVKQAEKFARERADLEDVEGWKYDSIHGTRRCNNEGCIGGFGVYYSIDNPNFRFCASCFPNRDSLIANRAVYSAETLDQILVRAKIKEEWKFVPSQHGADGTTECWVDCDCQQCYYAYDGEAEHYTGYYRLCGTNDTVQLCDICWEMWISISDDEKHEVEWRIKKLYKNRKLPYYKN